MRDFSIDLAWAKIQAAITGLGAWLGMFLGGCDNFLYALIILTTHDVISGILVAIVQKRLSSAIGFRGISRKILMFGLVGMAAMIDAKIIGTGSALRTATICFYSSNQGLSVLENAAVLGLPVPEKLKGILQQLHKREEKDAADSDE